MKWKTKDFVAVPKTGDRKTISCFALFPTELSTGYTVWLEFYHEDRVFGPDTNDEEDPDVKYHWFLERRY